MFWNKKGKEQQKEIEKIKKGLMLLSKCNDLILNHLNLEYVPETEKKEPAKLVEKKPFSLSAEWGKMLAEYAAYNYITGECPDKKQEPKKKKRGQPKKK